MRHLKYWLIDGIVVTVTAGIVLAAAGSGAVPVLFEYAQLQASDGEPSDEFGYAMAIDKETLLVGAYSDDDHGGNAGAAYVFQRVASGAWQELVKLGALDAQPGDGFGRAVALSGAALVVGAPGVRSLGAHAGYGAVYVFEAGNGTGWTEVAKLTVLDGSPGDELGYRLAMDGDTVVAGVLNERPGNGFDLGSAYVFERDPVHSWRPSERLTVSGLETSAFFGSSVSVHENMTAVGAYLDRVGKIRSGAAYVFERSGESGVHQWTLRSRLVPPDPADFALFGHSIATFEDWVAVGAMGDGIDNAGSVYLYQQTGETWQFFTKLDSPDPGGREFGRGVALDENRLLVSSRFDDEQGLHAGAAFLFERVQTPTGVEWQLSRKLLASDGGQSDYLGLQLAIDGNTMALSSRVWSAGPETVYVFSEEVFSDGFESGDTSAWSATVP